MYAQQQFREKVEAWLYKVKDSPRARTWINMGYIFDNLSDVPSPIIHMYMRKSVRLIPDVSMNPITTLDIANVAIALPHRHKGIFKELMNVCHDIAQEHELLLYIENVISPEIRAYCNSRGWVHHPYHTSYYFPRT